MRLDIPLCIKIFIYILATATPLQSLALDPSAGPWRMSLPGNEASLQTLRNDEEKLDMYCLKQAYPQITGIEQSPSGDKWLILANGAKVLYSQTRPLTDADINSDSVPVAETMKMPYTLEPFRPDIPPGASPGRIRSKALLQALYGKTDAEVRKGLKSGKIRGKNVSLSQAAATSFLTAIPGLESAVAKNPSLAPYLDTAGGFYWRKIAGENRLSPHSYGIAVDLGVKVSPYWRWAKVMPHPKQKTYPPEIVGVMEDHGFIWGGKWHEYDLMHFEYRPELICKAKIKALYNR